MKKIAIVHDWFTTFAGSEKVIQQLLQLYPQAALFSLIDFLPPKDRALLNDVPIRTSFLQQMPLVAKHYRLYLGLMPLAIERLDVSGYDLVISNCHAVSKGVRTQPHQLHISYIHTPIRYAWDMQDEYLSVSGLRGLKGLAARALLTYIRGWDVQAAQRPDVLVASSAFVAGRIVPLYRRSASVIPPPVDTDYFTPGSAREDFYLAAGRLVPYKRMDLIAQAFRSMPDKKLVLIGDGPDAPKVKALCGSNVTWLGYQPDDVLREHLRRCKAFVFAAKEDFGILPLEAQACGTPVLAYGEGGARETLIPLGPGQAHPTAIHYPQQTPAHIRAAVLEFERDPERFSPAACRKNAERFASERFRAQFGGFVQSAWNGFVTNAQRRGAVPAP
jgi:glycosyltransferase involved in cell wall biosynthesis